MPADLPALLAALPATLPALVARFVLGGVLGLAGGLLGIGGGLIAIPVLGYLYGMEQHLAQGTALVMVAPNVLLGFIHYQQRQRLALRPLAAMSVLSMLTTFGAAHLAVRIAAARLQLGFALFLIALALYFAWEARRRPATPAVPAMPAPPTERPVPPLAMAVLGMICGAMSGLFTVGGVLIVVPALVGLYGMAQARAQGVALALVVPGALIALFTYAGAGQVDWRIGLPLAAGGLLTVSAGVSLAHHCPPLALRVAFCLVLLATGAGMLLA